MTYNYIKLKIKKFCQVANNKEWKKNRNLHAILLLDMILNDKYEAPYNKFPKDSPLPIISKSIVKSKLSKKFIDISNLEYNEMELQRVDNHKTNEINNEENFNECNSISKLML